MVKSYAVFSGQQGTLAELLCECASSDFRFQGSLWQLGRKFVVEEQGRKRKTGRRLRNGPGARGSALDVATGSFLMSGVLS